MISFASLFVGFVLGIVQVELMATGGVDRVELLLDGRVVADLREPFSAPLDLGCEPSPHELVAVAYDARGKELDRARQWINRPRATAEASLVLEEGRGGRGRAARLAWRALAGEAPTRVSVTFDGVPVAIADPARILLPAFEPAEVHILRADLEFGRGVSTSTELVFGGWRTVGTLAELTAIPVELEAKASLPPMDGLAGWLEARGVILEVAAVEVGGVDVVFVAEGSAVGELKRVLEQVELGAGPRRTAITSPKELEEEIARARADHRSGTTAGEDIRSRVIWPVATMSNQSVMVANVYPTTPWFDGGASGIERIATVPRVWPPWHREGQRIADAVVVAGLSAAEGNRRRAVVLALGPDAQDGSLLAPEEATRFLRRIGVPLHVWSVGRKRSPEATRWGASTTIRRSRDFDAALRQVLRATESQRIVWVQGSHLPQDLTVAPLARGIRLAR